MIAWAAAGLLVLAGVITIVVGLSSQASFGWFAYQPLANATFTLGGDTLFLTRTTAAGFIVTVLGLIALAFLAGLRLGKRPPR
jgi:heme/copper-type cytochrome/quinol oxidase subunit 1